MTGTSFAFKKAMKTLLLLLFTLSSTLTAYALSIPREVAAIMNQKLAHHGPNCWGTALYLKGISPVPRFVSTAEITFWQESSLCRPLEMGEQIKTGDILNVYGPEYIFSSDMELTEAQKFINFFEPGRYSETLQSGYSGFHRFLHSETFFNHSQVFGKESPNKDDPFKLTKLNEVYGRPRLERECQESPILAPYLRQFDNKPKSIRGSKCAYFSKVYRCKSFENFFTLNAEEKEMMKQIGRYQKRIFEAVVTTKRALSLKEKKEIQDFATTLLQELELQKLNVTDEYSRMLLSWKYFSTYSLLESIRWIEDV